MKRLNKKSLIVIVAFALAGIMFCGGIAVGAATTAGPGSQNDPVVSKSYLEYRLEKLQTEIENGTGTKASDSSAVGVNPAAASAFGKYERVELTRGERLMPGEGSTIILYSGSCTAVGAAGLVNLTDATVYKESYSIPMYNICLVPDDASGIVAGSTAVVFVGR